MKKFISAVFTIFLCLNFLFAEDDDVEEISAKKIEFNISTEISAGKMNGKISEFVMDENCQNNHMSQLDWDIKNINLLDFKAEFTIAKYFFVNADFAFGVPARSGFMQDYDWLNPYYWPDDDIYELTNYSKHNNFLTKYNRVSESIGVNILLPLGITICPYINYENEMISFDGMDGYYKYKSSNWKPTDMEGKVISYEQKAKNLFFCLGFDIAPVSFVELKVSGGISPKLTKIDAVDRHIVTRYAYWDHLYKATMYKGQAELLLGTERIKFGVRGDVYYLPEITGKTTSARLKTNGELLGKFGGTIGEGGSRRFLYDIMLTLKINF